MKFKSIITLGLGLAMSISAFAQSNSNNYWFGGIGGGANLAFDGQQYVDRPNSHSGVGTALDVYVGKWFNDFAGFRVGYQGLSTSDQYTDYGKYRFDYGHADLMFSVADWFIPYIHAGYTHIQKGGVAGGIGMMLPIRLTKRIAIVPDVKAMAHSNRLFNDGRGNIAGTLTGTLGLAINIGSRPKQIERVEIPVEVIKYRTDTVVVKEVRVDTVYIQKDIDEINKILSDIVLFDFDKYDLTPEAIPVLNQVADILKRHPKANVVVEGHTDSKGTEAYNQVLSENRAKAVVKYLVDQGVNAGMLSSVGYGKSRPITDNSTEEARHRNRRIEFRLK